MPWDAAVSKPARICGSLRCSCQVVVPVRRLPHVRVGLIDGEVRYAPEPLDRPAEGNVLICCSTPLAAIELDLYIKDPGRSIPGGRRGVFRWASETSAPAL